MAPDVPSTSARIRSVALVGNPNTGKSSVFNLLTGLRQRVGNFPGVTVEKREGQVQVPGLGEVRLLDLPGLYSLTPRSADEEVVTAVLLDRDSPLRPDAVVLVADASNLKRNLFLFTQVASLGLPMVLAVTMEDVSRGLGQTTDFQRLSEQLGVPVAILNPRSGEGLDELLKKIPHARRAQVSLPEPEGLNGLGDAYREDYGGFMLAAVGGNGQYQKALARDTVARYQLLDTLLQGVQKQAGEARIGLTEKLDRVLLHPVWGYAIFLGILFAIFQAVFLLASYPMDAIDGAMNGLSSLLNTLLPNSWLTRLITEGLIPGIGGILVFIPQIAILFALLAVLEDTGYMARVIFISDKIMRRFGLSGRSVVPLFSGLACAVPAIMAARTIENRKERLLTILVTPFMSCSARIPVFTVLTAVSVPERAIWGFLSLQGLVMFSMYMIGIFFAVGSAWVLKLFVKSKGRSHFMLELPYFKAPRWKNVLTESYLKSRAFVTDAGKIILVIALALWFLAAYGPGDAMEKAEARATAIAQKDNLPEVEAESLKQTLKLESSYAGVMGHAIEPAIRPLGFDWKIGMALIASFAAREVFVGTMATIHTVGADLEPGGRLLERMRQSRDAVTGKPTYRPSVAFSLMIFYLLAMQCMSTFSIVRRETNSWAWAIGQLVGMTALAYLCSWAVFGLME